MVRIFFDCDIISSFELRDKTLNNCYIAGPESEFQYHLGAKGMSTARLNNLKQHVHHPLPTIRFQAVRALGEGEFETEDFVEMLVAVLLNDASEGVRKAPHVALSDLGIATGRLARQS